MILRLPQTMRIQTSSWRHRQPASIRFARMLPGTSVSTWIPAFHAGMTQLRGALLELTEVRPPIFSKANKITKFKITDSEPFVLLYFRICARRGNFSHLETLGFGYSSGQDAKNAKFGNLFLLCAFTSLREMFRFFLVAASPR